MNNYSNKSMQHQTFYTDQGTIPFTKYYHHNKVMRTSLLVLSIVTGA